mgnify:FL=1
MTFYPYGSYRRRIRVINTSSNHAEAGLEDDFHYFTVSLAHDGSVLTDITATAIRWPWDTCASANVPLRNLIGMSISSRCLAAGEVSSPALQCTHMFDLAGLAIAHIGRSFAPGYQRQYDIEIPYGMDKNKTVTCNRDGKTVLSWDLADRECVSPPPYSQAPWRGGFLKWADRNLNADDAEAAIVLRRACDIGMGRGMDLDAIERAEDLSGLMLGVCFTMQPEQIVIARRQPDTIRNFDDDPDALLAEGPSPQI